VSADTVMRTWRLTKVWLVKELPETGDQNRKKSRANVVTSCQ
jgi:hypothetical protein